MNRLMAYAGTVDDRRIAPSHKRGSPKMKTKFLLCMIAALAIMPSAGLANEHANGPIKIGVLTDMSGVYSDFGGKGSVEAARLAVQDFGGSVLGRQIEVIAADHQNKPDIGSSIAREWYDRGGVNFITDGLNGAVALSVSKLAAENKKIFVSTGAVPTALTNEQCNPYTIHYVFDAYSLANGTPNVLVRQGKKSWFFLTVDYAFGHSLEEYASNVVEKQGGKVLGAVRHPLNNPDFSSFVLQAQASGAEIVALASTGPDTVNAIKQAREFGLTRKQIIAPLLVLITDVHALGLEIAQDLVLTTGWYWDMNEETREFSKRVFDKIGQMPSQNHAGVYSSTLSYLKAIKAAGTSDPTAVMAELKRMEINDMFAKKAKIRPDGRMVHDMYLAKVKKPADSKYAWDYYQIIDVIPASEAFLPLSSSKCPLLKS